MSFGCTQGSTPALAHCHSQPDPGFYSCHFGTSSATAGRACYAPAVGDREHSFPPTPMEQGEGRSPGGESAETGPPSYTHSPFPSLGTHTAQVAAPDGFQNREHTLPHTTTPLPSARRQTPCPRMKVNPLSRAPSSQDFHSPQSIRHTWCDNPNYGEDSSLFPRKPFRPHVSHWVSGFNSRCQAHLSLGTAQSEHLVNRVSLFNVLSLRIRRKSKTQTQISPGEWNLSQVGYLGSWFQQSHFKTSTCHPATSFSLSLASFLLSCVQEYK